MGHNENESARTAATQSSETAANCSVPGVRSFSRPALFERTLFALFPHHFFRRLVWCSLHTRQPEQHLEIRKIMWEKVPTSDSELSASQLPIGPAKFSMWHVCVLARRRLGDNGKEVQLCQGQIAFLPEWSWIGQVVQFTLDVAPPGLRLPAESRFRRSPTCLLCRRARMDGGFDARHEHCGRRRDAVDEQGAGCNVPGARRHRSQGGDVRGHTEFDAVTDTGFRKASHLGSTHD